MLSAFSCFFLLFLSHNIVLHYLSQHSLKTIKNLLRLRKLKNFPNPEGTKNNVAARFVHGGESNVYCLILAQKN